MEPHLGFTWPGKSTHIPHQAELNSWCLFHFHRCLGLGCSLPILYAFAPIRNTRATPPPNTSSCPDVASRAWGIITTTVTRTTTWMILPPSKGIHLRLSVDLYMTSTDMHCKPLAQIEQVKDKDISKKKKTRNKESRLPAAKPGRHLHRLLRAATRACNTEEYAYFACIKHKNTGPPVVFFILSHIFIFRSFNYLDKARMWQYESCIRPKPCFFQLLLNSYLCHTVLYAYQYHSQYLTHVSSSYTVSLIFDSHFFSTCENWSTDDTHAPCLRTCCTRISIDDRWQDEDKLTQGLEWLQQDPELDFNA
jgi:hypothetical protein